MLCNEWSLVIKLKINLGFSRQCDALFHNLCVELSVPKAGHTSLWLQLHSAQFNIFTLGSLTWIPTTHGHQKAKTWDTFLHFKIKKSLHIAWLLFGVMLLCRFLFLQAMFLQSEHLQTLINRFLWIHVQQVNARNKSQLNALINIININHIKLFKKS